MRFTLALLFGVVVAGCSSNEATPGLTLDGSVLQSQASSLSTAVGSASSDDAVAIATNLTSVANTAAALIPGSRGTAARSQLKTPASKSVCGCTASATKSCTLSACRIGNVTASGTVSWADGALECSNLTFDLDALGETRIENVTVNVGTTHLAIACNVTYGSDNLAGYIRATGGTTIDDVQYSWDATFTATDVTWASKKFTGGNVVLDGTLTSVSDTEGTKSTPVTGSLTL